MAYRLSDESRTSARVATLVLGQDSSVKFPLTHYHQRTRCRFDSDDVVMATLGSLSDVLCSGCYVFSGV